MLASLWDSSPWALAGFYSRAGAAWPHWSSLSPAPGSEEVAGHGQVPLEGRSRTTPACEQMKSIRQDLTGRRAPRGAGPGQGRDGRPGLL